MRRVPLYREIVSTLNAVENCRKSGNSEWLDRHEETLDQLADFLPSGSGIDCGTKIDRDRTKPNKLVLTFSFHHMDDNGMYCGWTEHTLTVTPSLQFEIDLHISGRDKNGIKEYLYEIYTHCLQSDVWRDDSGKWHSSQYETVK